MCKSCLRQAPLLVLCCLLQVPAWADEAELRNTIEQYVQAFNAQQIDRISAIWTDNATHVDRSTRERTEGREKILEDLKQVFQDQPATRISGEVDSIKAITETVVKVEGTTLLSVPDEPPTEAMFSAIFVNRDGTWKIDSMEETPVPQPVTPYDILKRLEWLVGRWVDESEVGRVDTTVAWTANRAFLTRSFVAQSEAGVEFEGTQVIGYDPRSNEIRSWTFNSDGSFGDGVWTASGDDWLIKSTQTTPEGLATSGTYVLSHKGEDQIELQLIGHEIEGEPQPNRDAVSLTRVVPAAATPSTNPERQDGASSSAGGSNQ